VVRGVECVLEVNIYYIHQFSAGRGIFNSPVKGLNLPLRTAQPPEALLRGIQQTVPLTESAKAIINNGSQYLIPSILQTNRPIVPSLQWIAAFVEEANKAAQPRGRNSSLSC